MTLEKTRISNQIRAADVQFDLICGSSRAIGYVNLFARILNSSGCSRDFVHAKTNLLLSREFLVET